MKRPIRLTERDLSRIVRRVINEIDDNTQVYSDFDSDKTGFIDNDYGPKDTTNQQPEETNKPPHATNRRPEGARHDYLYDFSGPNQGHMKDKYSVHFSEIHDSVVSNYGKDANIRDVVLHCLVLAKRGKYSPLMLEEYIFTQTDDKPKTGRERYFSLV